MNQTKIDAIKAIAAEENAIYNAKKEELTAAGFKSGERYAMLKDLKATADSAHAEYAKYAKGQISKALDAIIAAGKPARDAGARGRSAWKQAKFTMAQGCADYAK